MTGLKNELLTIRGIDVDSADLERLPFTDSRLAGVADAMENYLKGKYPGVVFHIDRVIPRDIDQLYDEFQLHEEISNAQIRVHALEAEDCLVFTDSYYALIQNDAYERMIEQRFKDTARGIRVFSTVYCMLGEEYKADYPVELAADDSQFIAYTWFLLPPSDKPFETIANAIRDKIREMGLSGEFTLYRLIKPLAEDATREDVFALIPAHSAQNPVYSDSLRVAQLGKDRGDSEWN